MKLSHVDDKIDKPTTATEGQVLTYKNNEWVADYAKGGIDEPTELEKGIIGGDEWVSGGSYTIGESVVIDENKLYLLVGEGGSTTKPSTDTTHSIWEETSISALTKEITNKSGFLSANIIFNHSQSKTMVDWVATDDCWVFAYMCSYSNEISIFLDIDGLRVAANASSSVWGSVFVPVKKGQRVTSHSTSTNAYIQAQAMKMQ